MSSLRSRTLFFLTFLKRDWRSGDMRLLFFSLVIAVSAVTTIGFFADRMNRALGFQSADLLGGDLQLSGPQPLDPVLLERANQFNVTTASSVEFASVVLYADRFQLSGVKAISTGFPPRGEMRTAMDRYSDDQATHDVPTSGNAWVESRLLHVLDMEIGDPIQVGETRLRVSRVLTYEPGRVGNFFGFAPRVLINIVDIPSTGIVRPGSRLTYRYLFAGEASAINDYKKWLEPRLSSNHTLFDVGTDTSAPGKAAERAERYHGLVSLLAVLLAGVAIAMAAHRYSERHFDSSALLRCMGATQKDVLLLYLPQFMLLGLIASLLGGLIGYLAHHVIVAILGDALPSRFPEARAYPAAYGVLVGMITLIGFALPPLLRLKNVPPLRVLRRELKPMPLKGWIVYGSALFAMALLLWRYTGDYRQLGIVAFASLSAAVMVWLVTWALLRALRTLPLPAGPWRLGAGSLSRRGSGGAAQITAFALTFLAMAIILLVRSDLLSAWQQQLPSDTPNYFAFNIFPPDRDAMENYFIEHRIRGTAFYPMVRGRLIAINDVTVRDLVSKEDQDDSAINRELNLTWSKNLPNDNRLLEGAWWHADNPRGRVSVESRLAKRLGIHLGDELTFSLSGHQLLAHVQSLREVQWESFHPNFYMIFPPQALSDYSATYITSFYLDTNQKSHLRALLQRFPVITVLELDRVLDRAKTIIRQVSLAVEFQLIFVLLAGVAVLFAALMSSQEARMYEGGLLRTFGASRLQLRRAYVIEFAGFGLIAGIIAAVGAEMTIYFLYRIVFDLPFRQNITLLVGLPLSSSLLIGLIGLWGTRPVLQQPPLTILREYT